MVPPPVCQPPFAGWAQQHPRGGQTCKDFANGVCHRGAQCKFAHVGAMSSNAGPQLCKDFNNGLCNRGASCKFSHVMEACGPTGRDPGYGAPCAPPIMAPPPPLPSMRSQTMPDVQLARDSLPPQPGQDEFFRRPDNWPGRGYLVRYVGEAIHREQNTPLNVRCC